MLACELFNNHGKSFKNEDTIGTEFDSASYLVASLCQGHPHLVQADSSSNLARSASRSSHRLQPTHAGGLCSMGAPRPFQQYQQDARSVKCFARSFHPALNKRRSR